MFKIVVGGIIAIILIGGILFAYNHKFSPILPTVQNVSSSTISTAGWKTYTNKEYGFSIKYPPDWTLKDSSYIYPRNGVISRLQGIKFPFVYIYSPVRYDFPGYINTAVQYRVGTGENCFIAPNLPFHQALCNLVVNPKTEENQKEYIIGQEIMLSFNLNLNSTSTPLPGAY